LLKLSKYERILVVVFILTLPLINPWVRGDGIGYYAFARALLIEHQLNFEKDWLAANQSFRMGRTDQEGHIVPEQYTSTGHLNNHYAVGPAILWSPFLIAAHLGVLSYDALGGHVPVNGYSRPYLLAMSLGTALFGFLALWISFGVARKYLPERWAFLATLGVWFASSLPVYMYFNPSWSHAHSAFVVALFFWYWDRTRHARSWAQWIILGALAGLMMDVYYPNAILLLLPLIESLALFRKAIQSGETNVIGVLFLKDLIFAALVLGAFLPTLITKNVIFGNYFNFGYTESWYWNSPAFFKVCFSAEHGLFSWTPILILAFTGLFLFCRTDRVLGFYSIPVFVAYLYAIGCYQNWAGLSSFGNRFLVSLTVLFVLGLAAFFDWLAGTWQERGAAFLAHGGTALLIAWNFGLIYQWGTHLIPARGPISWRETSYNQVAVVPVRVGRTLKAYFTGRRELMGHIEEEDVKQLKSQQARGME
jgi:Dolichyl-phosphate-mannose-protein mannosyltransferase